MWRELLGIEQIALDDNFLDLGGHSLLIMRAIAALETRTGVRINPRSFVFNSLEQIAHEYDRASAPSVGRVSTDPGPRESIPRYSGVISRIFAALTQKA